MEKAAIKSFSIAARKLLIQSVKDKATLVGVAADGIREPEAASIPGIQYFRYSSGKTPYSLDAKGIGQRRALVDAIGQKKERNGDRYETAYESIVEEVAYTWFNRLIAIRFMEVNEFLPSGVKVLSGDNGKAEPEMVARPFDTGMHFTEEERGKILELKSANRQDDLFGMLFIKQCNTLNSVLPGLFEMTNDYTELLLNIKFTDTDGVVSKLVREISESDFIEAVEIIGWLYQYYNTDLKAEAEALKEKNTKISKEMIPAATQLFTPDWIVRYMVENSLGRLWLEGHPDTVLRSKWKYFLDEADQTEEVAEQLKTARANTRNLTPEDITFMDPCMGSGHILVYAFEVLMQIYESAGYMQKDAARLIIRKNLYGLDIDKRAYQLAYFALMMCARKYDKRFFETDSSPQVYHPQGYGDGEEYGSLIPRINPNMIGTEPKKEKTDVTAYAEYEADLRIWNFKRLLTIKYDVVCTNPPYMGSSGMNAKLSEFVKKNYPDSKSDLFAVFIEKCGEMLNPNGFQAMITQHAWMFLSSYEKLRSKLLHRDIVNMAHLGARAFEEIGGERVQTTAFVLNVRKTPDFLATYARLVDFDSQDKKETAFLNGEHRYIAATDNFAKIPGSPVAYWVGINFVNLFDDKYKFSHVASAKAGLSTTDNIKFLRFWHEVNFSSIGFEYENLEQTKDCAYTFIPHPKGGTFRKWYGNLEYIVDWFNNGANIRKAAEGASGGRIVGSEYYFKEGLTWSDITSGGNLSVRYMPFGMIFNSSAPSCFCNNNYMIYYLMAFMNTKIAKEYLRYLAPSYHFNAGPIEKLPVVVYEQHVDSINNTVKQCLSLSRTDWDSFETSWDFTHHPLVPIRNEEFGMRNNSEFRTLNSAFSNWEREAAERFDTLKANEEELNRIFIDIYGLQDELTPDVEDKDVTVRRADLGREIRSLISYAVGCMFGRYSLDTDGLAYAGGDWDPSKYRRFAPDADNIIPITDEDHFKDDIVARFTEFVRIAYGEKNLEENLDFIAEALGTRGNTSRGIIRNYFLKEFYKDHLKVYQKRPIYWLFDSGKENGFKALMYLHRYNPDTIGKLRVDYLNRIQDIYDKEAESVQKTIDVSSDSKDIADARKRLEKLTKQISETRNYDALIGHLAPARISLDLDDGVNANYEKLQTIDGRKYEILGRI